MIYKEKERGGGGTEAMLLFMFMFVRKERTGFLVICHRVNIYVEFKNRLDSKT